MAALNDAQKLFIVQALACHDTPKQVVEAVKQEFGIDVTPQQLQAYNPETVAGKRMSKKLKDIFEATRQRFLADISTIPIANQAFRLRALNRLYERAAGAGNSPLAAQLIEQAAKEAGGAFTNKHKLEHTGKDGGPIKTAAGPVDLSDLTDEELDVLERVAAKREPGANPG